MQKVLEEYKPDAADSTKVVPKPGFAIQCIVDSVIAFLESMRPRKYKHLDEIKAKDVVYLNVGSLPNVRAPIDTSGRDVLDLEKKGLALSMNDLLNLEIPMAVGSIRKVSTSPNVWAVDIICHEWVIRTLLENNLFLSEFGKFVLEVVGSELRLKFATSWTRHEEQYVGKVNNSPVHFVAFHELESHNEEKTLQEMLEKVNNNKIKGEKLEVVLPGATKSAAKSTSGTFLDVPNVEKVPEEDQGISTFASVLASALPVTSTVWKPAVKDYSMKLVGKNTDYECVINVHFDLLRVDMKLADANLDFSVSEIDNKATLMLDLPRSHLFGYDGLALDRIPLLAIDPIQIPPDFSISNDSDPKAKYNSKTGALTIRIPVLKVNQS